MSEGGEAVRRGVRSGVVPVPDAQRAAAVLLLLALMGPILGAFIGKGPTLLDQMRSGWYSLPMAAFAAAAMLLPIRNPKDYFGGAFMVGLGLFALWAASDLPGMRGFAFGPGTAPRMFAYTLMGLGVAVALTGLFTDGPPEEPFAFSGPIGGAILVVALIPVTYFAPRIGRMVTGVPPDIVVALVGALLVLGLALVVRFFAPRGPVFITAATLIFAISVRPLGLVISSFVSLIISAYATDEIRWIETIIWAAVLTLFCSLLFPYGLNLPLQLWPRF